MFLLQFVLALGPYLSQVSTAEAGIQFLSSVGSNGPWAALSGFSLLQILKAWERDRQTMFESIQGIRPSVDSLKTSVDRLAERIDEKLPKEGKN